MSYCVECVIYNIIKYCNNFYNEHFLNNSVGTFLGQICNCHFTIVHKMIVNDASTEIIVQRNSIANIFLSGEATLPKCPHYRTLTINLGSKEEKQLLLEKTFFPKYAFQSQTWNMDMRVVIKIKIN